jgi:hypothetical protein
MSDMSSETISGLVKEARMMLAIFRMDPRCDALISTMCDAIVALQARIATLEEQLAASFRANDRDSADYESRIAKLEQQND